MRLDQYSWRELLRQTEETLNGPLCDEARAFLDKRRLNVASVEALMHDARLDIAAAGNRTRVCYALPVREALATAFGAVNLHLLSQSATLTQELADSVRGNMQSVRNWEHFQETRSKHTKLTQRFNEIGRRLTTLTYAIETLFKMSYGEYELG